MKKNSSSTQPRKIERRVSIFDVKSPFVVTEEQHNVICELLKNPHKVDGALQHLEEVSPRGNWVTGKSNWLRFQVDSRFITDAKFKTLLNKLFKHIK